MRNPAIRLSLAIAAAALGMSLAAVDAAPAPLPSTHDVGHPVTLAASQDSYAFSRAQLRAFVVAAQRIDAIITRARRDAPDAGAEAISRRVDDEARAVIAAASGLDHATYRRIARAVRVHEPTRFRVRAILAELRRDGTVERLQTADRSGL